MLTKFWSKTKANQISKKSRAFKMGWSYGESRFKTALTSVGNEAIIGHCFLISECRILHSVLIFSMLSYLSTRLGFAICWNWL